MIFRTEYLCQPEIYNNKYGYKISYRVLPWTYISISCQAGITQLRHHDGRSSVIRDVSIEHPCFVIHVYYHEKMDVSYRKLSVVEYFAI